MCLFRSACFPIDDVSNFGVGSICAIQVCATELNSFFIVHETKYISVEISVFEGVPKVDINVVTLSNAEQYLIEFVAGNTIADFMLECSVW